MAMIMLAHASPAVRRKMAMALREKGEFIAGETSDGMEACMMYRRIKPDVLVMDMLLSGKNGIECLRTLRTEDPAAKVLITYNGQYRELREIALSEGCSGFIQNPCDEQEVYQKVQSILRKRSFWQMIKSEIRCMKRVLSDTV